MAPWGRRVQAGPAASTVPLGAWSPQDRLRVSDGGDGFGTWCCAGQGCFVQPPGRAGPAGWRGGKWGAKEPGQGHGKGSCWA